VIKNAKIALIFSQPISGKYTAVILNKRNHCEKKAIFKIVKKEEL
jgi:hypothetical protein